MVLSLGFACGACGVKYTTLAQHFRWHPGCDPKPLAVPVRPAAPLVQCTPREVQELTAREAYMAAVTSTDSMR